MRTVFLLFDSLNRTALECYGGTAVATPNFNRLAARAVTFDRHYVGSLPCMPARRDLHTGRLNFMHRSWGPLEPFDNSFARILSAGGVYTHLVTDHLHYFEDGGAGYANAYDSWEFIRGQENDPWVAMVRPPLERWRARYDDRHYGLDAVDPARPAITRGTTPGMAWKKLRNLANRERIVAEEDFPAVKCFAAGLDFLDLNRGADDWLLQIETFDPHEPFHAPERFRDRYRTGWNGKILDWPVYERVVNAPEEIAEIRANYAALVALCDDCLGRLLDRFDEHDFWRDTCLIVTTDHGFLLAEHEWWGKNRTPYYEEISHIPLIVWHPDHADQAGRRRRALTQTIDLMPTILDLAGQPVPAEVRGRSLLPLLAEDRPLRDGLIFGMFGGPVGVVDDRFSYFHYPRDLDGCGLHEYTLMPAHMNAPFALDELAGMSVAGPFDFTKGVPVMRIQAWAGRNRRPPGHDGTGFDEAGDALYDLAEDPGQDNRLHDPATAARLRDILARRLAAHDTPLEMLRHYGLAPATSGGASHG